MFRTSSASASGAEQGIHQYIHPDLWRMFYKNPTAIHASHNGLDPYGFSTRGLVLYVPLFAPKSVGFKSVDAYEHTCTPTGTTLFWTPNGWDLGGVDELISCGNAASLQLANKVSVEAWIYAHSIAEDATKAIMGKIAILTTNGYGLTTYDGYARFYVQNKWAVDPSLLGLNAWQHVLGTYDKDLGGNEIILYMEGSAVDTGTETDAITDSGGNFEIGTLNAGTAYGYFDGLVGEVRVYNRNLSAEEVARNYNCTKWRYQ